MSADETTAADAAGDATGDRDGPAAPFDALHVPLHGFELSVEVDRGVYADGQTVRITVAAGNDAPRAVEHRYPGWQRVVLSVRDERHRAVASDELVDAPPGRSVPPTTPFADRWLPGQMVLLPTWWDQRAGDLRPGWVADAGPAERVPPGRYRVRATWLGREPGPRVAPREAWSRWFELV